MTHQNRIFGKVYEPLLEEWERREAEGILPKAYRCFRRVLGNYYKGSAKFTAKKKEQFNQLNEAALAIAKARKKFLDALRAKPEEFKAAVEDKTRIPASQVADRNRPNKQYDESLKQAHNLRYAFIDGCDAQQKADEKHGVD